MRPKVFYAAAAVVFVGAIAAAWLAFPTLYGCGDRPTSMTTSLGDVQSVCRDSGPDVIMGTAEGNYSDQQAPPISADWRVAPRAGLLAGSFFLATILLRIGSGIPERPTRIVAA